MKNFSILMMLFALAFMVSCGNSSNEEETDETTNNDSVAKTVTVELEKLWQTDTLLATSESELYHPKTNTIFVSSIGNVPPDSKDGDGTIAKIDTEGKIIEQTWIKGLSAPKGLGYFGDFLYVTDITDVVKINISTSKIEKKYPVEGSVFLNDLDVDSNGDVYFTDSGTDKVYVLKNDTVSVFAQIAEVNPNGILVEKDRVLALAYNAKGLIAIDKTTKEQTYLAKDIPNGDGIVAIDAGYIVSAWNGEVFFVANTENAKVVKILDTQEEKLNTADIASIPEQNILLVPTFFGNTVVAYKINVK